MTPTLDQRIAYQNHMLKRQAHLRAQKLPAIACRYDDGPASYCLVNCNSDECAGCVEQDLKIREAIDG